YTWANFLLTSVTGPRVDTTQLTQFTYDSSGALTSVTNALGQVTQITQHLPGGLPQTIIDPNGVTTEITYDERLRVLTRTMLTGPAPPPTAYAYDAAGNLLSVMLPDGSTLTNPYDAAHRLTSTADLFGQRLAYTLDALGNRTQTQVLDAGSTVQRQHTASF